MYEEHYSKGNDVLEHFLGRKWGGGEGESLYVAGRCEGIPRGPAASSCWYSEVLGRDRAQGWSVLHWAMSLGPQTIFKDSLRFWGFHVRPTQLWAILSTLSVVSGTGSWEMTTLKTLEVKLWFKMHFRDVLNPGMGAPSPPLSPPTLSLCLQIRMWLSATALGHVCCHASAMTRTWWSWTNSLKL